MGLIQRNAQGALETTALAREHLLPESPYFVGDYMGLAAESAEVIDLVERLRSNRPADIDQQGHAFIYRDGIPSAMEASQWARHFTLSLAGRARNVAPALAETLHMDGVRHLVDVAGGTGIYSLVSTTTGATVGPPAKTGPSILEKMRFSPLRFSSAPRMEDDLEKSIKSASPPARP